MVGAMLGLLAFILAFTFGLVAARFDTRRQVLLDEANAIGTTYLRAGMLPEQGEKIRALLRDYVSVRLNAVRPGNAAEGNTPVGEHSTAAMGGSRERRAEKPQFHCGRSIRPVAQ